MASSNPPPAGNSDNKQEAEKETPTAGVHQDQSPVTPLPKKRIIMNMIKDKLVNDTNVRVVVLHGQAGVGKTQLAREISREALTYTTTDSDQGFFGGTLWLSLNKKYHDDHALLEDLARQLSVLPSAEGGFEDDDDDDDETGGDEETKRLKEMTKLEEAISEKLEAMTKSASTSGLKRHVLLILDGVAEAALADVKARVVDRVEQLMKKNDSLRVLATSQGSSGGGVESNPSFAVISVDALGEADFAALVKELGDAEGLEDTNLMANKFSERLFKSGSGVTLPAAAGVLVVKALKHNFFDSAARMAALDALLNEAAKASDKAAALARFAYETLPSRDGGVLAECCWHCGKFFGLGGNRSVHYNELIAHWILEGYFDGRGGSVAKAYAEGFKVFRELLRRSVLKVQQDEDFVCMEALALAVQDRRIEGFYEKAKLGLPCAFAEDRDWRGFGKIAVADGMIKSVVRRKKWTAVSTLFIDGERLSHEVADTFFEPMKKELVSLVVPSPRLRNLDFIGNLSKFAKLGMLVLRGCDMLENADSVRELKSLTVLEISGAKALMRIADDVFENMAQLRSLNLAGSSIESLPSSVSKLTRLRWVVLKGCSRLKLVPSLRTFEDLEVLDVSGVCSFENFRGRYLGNFTKLKALDFSQAHIAPLPFVHSLTSLTRLSLKGCVEITRLPMLDKLKGLRVLEVPGAKKLKEFYKPILENKEALEILDLSGSEITHLPESFNNLPKLEHLNLSQMSLLTDFSNVSFEKFTSLQSLNLSSTNAESLPKLSGLSRLRELLLSDCQHLEALPEMEGLTSLEVLDLSRALELKAIPDQVPKATKLRKLLLPGCKKLEKIPTLAGLGELEVLNLSGCEALADIEKQPFQEMVGLQKLDLSGTKVQHLTAFSSPNKLRQLLLEKCAELSEIPSLETLPELEELNLCGAKSLKKLEATSSGDTSKLRVLNVSETSIADLSVDFAKCTNLEELSLRGCVISDLKQQLEKLTSLKVLDLSETSLAPQKTENPAEVGQKTSLDLEDFKSLERLLNLTSLHLWGFQVKTFPYWISNLVHLKSLRLPDLKEVSELNWGLIKRLPDDLNWEECGIFKIASTKSPSSRPSISVKGTKIFEALKKNQDAWSNHFGEFRIYVCPFAGSDNDDDVYRLRVEAFYEKIYFKAIRCPESCKRFLEVRGFENRPEGLGEDALKRVEYISFIEDSFVAKLSDLGVGDLEAMRGLWLERCAKTECVFSEESGTIKFGEGFNILWASNMPVLKLLYSGAVKDQSFNNLTHLYLDTCPMLEHIFSLPQVLPEKLEKLEAKFCGKLKALFKCEGSEKKPCELSSLRELYLLELPELSEIGVKFPCLEKAKVKGCPKLEKEKFIESLGGQSKKVAWFEENWEGIVTKVTKE